MRLAYHVFTRRQSPSIRADPRDSGGVSAEAPARMCAMLVPHSIAVDTRSPADRSGLPRTRWGCGPYPGTRPPCISEPR
jgi:hypothetical protein